MQNELNNLKLELNKLTNNFKDELAAIRANRPTSKLVEDIKVDYFGQTTPIKQLASISVVLPRELQINVWDSSAVMAVAKAIDMANVGASANVQGNLVRVNLPSLTEERREELVKVIKSLAENYRIRIRSLRDEYNKKAKNVADGGGMSEDEKFSFQKKIQEKIDNANAEIEMLLNNKIKEIKE